MRTLLLLLCCTFYLNAFEIVIGFQKDGATDRMARVMAEFLQEELKEPINIKNIAGEGSKKAADYVLKQPLEKTVLFASTFSPYLSTTSLSKSANYTIDDFSMLNLQWFDYDLIAVNKTSKYNSLLELINHLQTTTKPIKVAVNYKSSGHLLLMILLEKFNISKTNISIHTYAGGKYSRDALFNQEVDFIVIPANGSELFKNRLKPLAVSKSKRTKRWDAPTINEVLKPFNINVPLLKGSIRGFAVSKAFKEKYPEKYRYLHFTLKRLLASKRVQNELKKRHIGYLWLGNRLSNQVIKDSYEVVKLHHHLLK